MNNQLKIDILRSCNHENVYLPNNKEQEETIIELLNQRLICRFKNKLELDITGLGQIILKTLQDIEKLERE